MLRTAFALSAVCLATLLAVSAVAGGVAATTWGNGPSEQAPTASWFGSTGLIVTPTAYVLDPARAQVSYHHIASDHDAPAVKTYNANVGVIPGLEVGASRIDDGIDAETVFNAKYHLQMSKLLNTAGMPDVAVGVFDLSNQINRAWYVVASKQVDLGDQAIPSIGLHLGFARNKAREGQLDGIFGGVDASICKNILAQAEYDSDKLNGCVRYYPCKWVSLDVGSVHSNFAYGATGHIDW